MSNRTEDTTLVGRIDDMYYFVESIFEHRDDFRGVTGCAGISVNDEHAKEIMSLDNAEERYSYVWEEMNAESADDNCPKCRGTAQIIGCEDCGYSSLSAWCTQIINTDGIDAFIDDAGHEAVAAVHEITGDTEYVDIHSCGRIFASLKLNDFDEVYNRKALVAALAYEDGAVGYDYAVRVIFGR